MKDTLLQQLTALRNELAHGRRSSADVATRLRELGIAVPAEDLPWAVLALSRGIEEGGASFVPPIVVSATYLLLEGRVADVVCDPWAGLGVLAANVQKAVGAKRAIVCTQDQNSVALARLLAPGVEFHTGDPLSFLESVTQPIDVLASVLPIGLRASRPVDLLREAADLKPVGRGGDLASALVAAGSIRLAADGIGLFVVSPDFFFGRHSIVKELPRLGLGLVAALALPVGSFAPFRNVPTYLVVVERRDSDQMFVARLSHDAQTNRQIVANLRHQQVDGPLDLGRRSEQSNRISCT
jgi:hypothetical protein